MNEIISSILDAEKKADSIIKEAQDKSKQILLIGEEQSENIKYKAIDNFKIQKKLKLSKANEKADKEYLEIFNKGKESALELKTLTLPKIDQVADEIMGEIIK